MQNDGKICKLPDRAYLFSPNSAVPTGDGIEGLFDLDDSVVADGMAAALPDSPTAEQL
jgi:hypothetical protein